MNIHSGGDIRLAAGREPGRLQVCRVQEGSFFGRGIELLELRPAGGWSGAEEQDSDLFAAGVRDTSAIKDSGIGHVFAQQAHYGTCP